MNYKIGGEHIKKKPPIEKKDLGPIILAHGLFGFKRIRFIHYFNGVVKHLRNHGYEVYATEVSRTGSIAKRADQLKKKLFDKPELRERLEILLKGERGGRHGSEDPFHQGRAKGLNIIAHSMGGLDSRHLITHLGMAPCIDTLITISTPHNADHIIDLIHSPIGRGLKIIDLLKRLFVDLDALKDLTTEAIIEFNENTPDMPGVRYYSYAGVKDYIHRREFFHHTFKYLKDNFGPNDGLVTVEGAKWGTYLGAIEADHMEEVGWGNFLNIPEDLYFPEILRGISIDFIKRFNDGYFDHLGFYLDLVKNLSELDEIK